MNRLRFLLLASALVLPLAGTAVADESNRAFRGTEPDGATDRGLDQPPMKAEPIAPLPIDPGEASRDLGLADPGALAKGFGTVTRGADGSLERSAAPAEVERALGERLERAAVPQAGDAEATLEEDPLQPQERAIVGDDNRIRVKENTTFPFRAIGYLYTTRGDRAGTCSGTLIGPRTVITAAHCVYSHERGGWADTITFYPGANGDGNFPYKGYAYDRVSVLQGFLDNWEGFYGSVVPWDLAVITLREAAGERVGWLGYGSNDRSAFLAYNVGYPGDKPDATMWRDKCPIAAADMRDSEFIHRCDTWPGSSGSSMYRYQSDPENRSVEGINVAEVRLDDRTKSYNIGVPLNSGYFEWVRKLRR